MQTFITDLPYNNYGFLFLDRKRLVKQLLETRQIMATLAGTSNGWRNHPAVKMWRGKETMLLDYGRNNAIELQRRNYMWENNFNETVESYLTIQKTRDTSDEWDIDEYYRVLYTHRGRLWEKDPEYYRTWSMYSDFRNYTCCERCDFFWPSHIKQGAI